MFIGEGSQARLIEILLELDKLQSEGGKTYPLWCRIKNLVTELHWKTINYLIRNYDVIILPDFRVSQMVRGRKLGKMTKRLMMMYSFYSFKERLDWKCRTHGKKLIIVDESFTSRTCGNCGVLNNIKGLETFNCKQCNISIDRDINGSRNIFIKNVIPRDT